jgi:hypothetical protein
MICCGKRYVFLKKLCLTAALASVMAVDVSAQPTSFTNLDFDTALKQAIAKEKGERVKKVAESSSSNSQSLSKSEKESRPKLRTIDIKLAKNSATIAPQDPAPRVDKSNRDSISSMTSWEPADKGNCKYPNSDADLLNKGSALREILFRFSGKDDFYSSFCKSVCKDPKTTGWMTGMALRSGSGTSFAFAKKNGRCQYKIVKKPETKWAALSGIKTACTCFPNS